MLISELGILPIDKSKNIEEGQHIVEIKSLPRTIKKPVEYLGHITSSYHSPTLKHCVAMALIKGGNQLMGKKIFVSKTNSSETVEAEIVNPVFLDPKNKRLTS